MSTRDWHIVKVGGSLLSRSTLSVDLRAWLDSPAGSGRVVLLAGGGQFVDALRDYDTVHRFDSRFTHKTAIALMDYSGWLLHQLLPELQIARSFDECEESQSGSPLLLLASQWLLEAEPHLPGIPLEIGWQVTSDSIAARVAEILQAGKLTLLKSTPPPEGIVAGHWNELADRGYIDPSFTRHTNDFVRIEAYELPRLP